MHRLQSPGRDVDFKVVRTGDNRAVTEARCGNTPAHPSTRGGGLTASRRRGETYTGVGAASRGLGCRLQLEKYTPAAVPDA